MLRRRLLVVLASIIAVSSARIEYENDRGNWTEQKPFQIIMAWYLRRTYAVTVQVIHRSERDSMYYYSSRFVRVIHKRSGTAVSIMRYVIELKDRQRSYDPSLNGNESVSSNASDTYDAASVASSRAGIPQVFSNWKQPVVNCSECTTILMIPDEATFRMFLKRGGFWRRNKVKLMLIVVVPDRLDILCRGEPEKRRWKKSVRDILERVWSEDQVLNIFLSAPTSTCIKDYLFAWNPFAISRNGGSGALKRLKVSPLDPDFNKTMSEFRISLKNMNGYPFKVTIFERVPTMVTSFDELPRDVKNKESEYEIENLAGLDGWILKTLASSMNCTVVFSPPTDGILYGWRARNGTYYGMLADIVNRRIDFAANGVYLKDYHTDTSAEFTTPVSSVSICIVVPREGKIPQWLQIFQCFSPMVWKLLLVNIIIYGLLRHILRTLLRERRPRRNLLETMIETVLIFVGSPQNLPKLHSARVLVGFSLLFNVIVIGTFQGTLYEGFTNPKYFEDINTLEELDQSGLKIGTGSPNLRSIFGDDDDLPILSSLQRKFYVSNTSWESGTIDRAAWQQDIAAIERKNDLELNINTRFLDESGEPVLHIVQECPTSYHLTFMVPSGAFHLQRVNVLLRRMVESGLIPYWYNSTVELLILKSHYAMAKKLEVKHKTKPFNLEDLQTSFIVLGSGSLLSTLVFIGEIVITRRKILRGRRMSKIKIATRNFSQD